MIMKFLLFFLVLPITILAASNFGDYLSSEEDILEALSHEEISFTQYYDLIELYRDKVNVFGDDLDRLLVIPGVDTRWIEAIENAAGKAGQYSDLEIFLRWFPFDFDRISAFIVFERSKKGLIGGGIRIYSHNKYVEDYIPTSNFKFKGRYDRAKIDLSLVSDQYGFRVRRRKLQMGIFGGDLTLGSFYQGLGEGLIMGKEFHVPGALRRNSFEESFQTPQDNLFNGARYYIDFDNISAGAILSRAVYDSVAVNGFGSELLWSKIDNLEIGGVLAYGDLRVRKQSEIYNQIYGSLFARSDLENTKINGEVGVGKAGSPGLMMELIHRREDIKALVEFWSYHEDFHPLHSKGISDYREIDIELDSVEFIHESRQAGETGASMKINLPLAEMLSLDMDQSGFRTPANGDWAINSSSGLYYRDGSDKRLRGEFSWEKRTLSTGVRLKETIRLNGNWPIGEFIETNSYFRFRWTTADDDRTRSLSTYIEGLYKRFEPTVLRLRIKRMKSNMTDPDNGYWEMRFRDEIRTGPVLWIFEARYADYDKPDKESLLEFRTTAGYNVR